MQKQKIVAVSCLLLTFQKISLAATGDASQQVLQKLSQDLYTYVVAIGILIAAPITLFAGVMLASGDPDKIKSGWEWLTYLVQGLVLLALAAFLFKVIGQDILLIG